jgi:hypothetical protein
VGERQRTPAFDGAGVHSTPGVHPKTETEKMVTVLDKENTCHKRKRSSLSTERS